MRAVLIIILAVLLLGLIGWISFSTGPNRTSINVETNQIRQDTTKAVQSGAELLHKAGNELEKKTAPPNESAPPAKSGPAPASR